MKKIAIFLVLLMILQVSNVFFIPINAKSIDESKNKFLDDNSVINQVANKNKIDFKQYSHLLTTEEMNKLQKQVGIYNKNKNYNIKYNNLGTGLTPPTEDEWSAMVGTINVVNENLPNTPIESIIDFSQDPCFPQVRSQGSQGSCAAWAATYYANGYIQAKNNNWIEAGIGNNNQLLSPAFTYNKCNYGQDGGSHTWYNGYVMRDVGVCSWSAMPYNQYDDVGWGNENAWRDAPNYRIGDVFMLYASYDDDDINTIKNALNSGYPVTFALHANSYSNFGSDDVLGLNDMVSSYNHANTIVAYDDTIIDVESGETGAFKCVNSWGGNWGPNTNGFYWMTYDAFKGSQNTYPVCWFSDLYTSTQPSLLAVWELNPPCDRDAAIELGIGSYDTSLDNRWPWWNGHSSVMHVYPSFMCLDITEFYDEWSLNENNFYLEVGDAVDIDGVITSFKIEFYQESYIPPSASRISSESLDVPRLSPGYVESYFPYTELPNNPPYRPTNPNPENGAIDVDTSITLSVGVSDPDGDVMDVTFYNAFDSSVIGEDNNVVSGTNASISWMGLAFETEYNWYAVTSDGEYTNTSVIWNFTTKELQPEKFYANQDINVQNGGILGSLSDTWNSNDIFMQLSERESGGKPSKRHSYMEHKWIIPVTGGFQSYVFYVEAYHTINSENDDFIFSYSLNDIQYTNMMTVTKTIDDDSYQLYIMPTTISGSVYIRVKDFDQTQGNRNCDTLSIDHMYIEGAGTPPPNRAPNKPTDPSPFDTENFIDINPTLSVYVYDPDGDEMDVTFFKQSGEIIGTVTKVASGSRASIIWVDLSYETTYGWYAKAKDEDFENTSELWSFTTRNDVPPTNIYVSDISWSVRTAGKNIFLSHIVTVMSPQGVVSDATVYSTLTNMDSDKMYSFLGVTDSTGKITFEQKVKSGEYEAFVTDITHSTFTYDSTLNLDNPDSFTV